MAENSATFVLFAGLVRKTQMARGSGTTTKQVDDLRQQLAEALAAQQAAEQALAAVQRSKEGSKAGSSESVGQDDEEMSKAPPFKIGLGPATRRTR